MRSFRERCGFCGSNGIRAAAAAKVLIVWSVVLCRLHRMNHIIGVTGRVVDAVVAAVSGVSQCRSVKKVKVGPQELTKQNSGVCGSVVAAGYRIPAAGEARNMTGSIARGKIRIDAGMQQCNRRAAHAVLVHRFPIRLRQSVL